MANKLCEAVHKNTPHTNFRNYQKLRIALFFTLLIGKLWADTVVSHQIVLNFTRLTYMIPMSLSFGIIIRVGHVLGEGNVQEARLRSLRYYSYGLLLGRISHLPVTVS